MAQNIQLKKNAQTFMNTFYQQNADCKEAQNQPTKGILIQTAHNLIQVIQLLTLQFDNLLKQMCVLQVKVKSQEKRKKIETVIQSEIKKSQPKPSQSKIEPSTYSNLYDLISHSLGSDSEKLKGVVYQNILSENPEAEPTYSQLFSNNRFNKKILKTICSIYDCQIFIFDGQTRHKTLYGTNLKNIIQIYQINKTYQYLINKNNNNNNNQGKQQQSNLSKNQSNNKKSKYQQTLNQKAEQQNQKQQQSSSQQQSQSQQQQQQQGLLCETQNKQQLDQIHKIQLIPPEPTKLITMTQNPINKISTQNIPLLETTSNFNKIRENMNYEQYRQYYYDIFKQKYPWMGFSQLTQELQTQWKSHQINGN